jgi:hypothetical protein
MPDATELRQRLVGRDLVEEAWQLDRSRGRLARELNKRSEASPRRMVVTAFGVWIGHGHGWGKSPVPARRQMVSKSLSGAACTKYSIKDSARSIRASLHGISIARNPAPGRGWPLIELAVASVIVDEDCWMAV